jgi:hypothetical protein
LPRRGACFLEEFIVVELNKDGGGDVSSVDRMGEHTNNMLGHIKAGLTKYNNKRVKGYKATNKRAKRLARSSLYGGNGLRSLGATRRLKSQGLHKFAWQRGYACFSVGKSQADAVARRLLVDIWKMRTGRISPQALGLIMNAVGSPL